MFIVVGFGFGHVSVSDVGFAFRLNTMRMHSYE